MVMLENGLSAAMNAKITGSGEETLILAHGYGGDQSVWDKILPSLSQRYSVLVFDWNFSGTVKHLNLFEPEKYSSYEAFADDLIALMGEMNLNLSVFIGHSMSGMIGCIASIKRPDLFKRLVLLGASPRYLNSEDYEGGLEKAEIEQILSSIESNFQTWASSFAALAVGGNDSHSIEKFGKLLGGMKPEVALSVAKTIFHSDEREVLEKVQVPCTIVQTTNDFVAPMSVAYYIKEKMKGKPTVEIIEADGHFPQLTVPELLLDVLDRVLGFDCDEKTSY